MQINIRKSAIKDLRKIAAEKKEIIHSKELALNYSFSAKQLKNIKKVIEEHYNEFINEWNAHFNY